MPSAFQYKQEVSSKLAEELKKTPLYETHLKNGGRIVDFGGWALPVQFSGIKDEHIGCRTNAALWDVSNMGEFIIEGAESLDLLQMLLVNDVSKTYPGKAVYSPDVYKRQLQRITYFMGDHRSNILSGAWRLTEVCYIIKIKYIHFVFHGISINLF